MIKNNNNNNNNTPYVRKKISPTLFTLSAIALLLLASPVLPFSSLLQPAQAQILMTFKTPTAAGGELEGGVIASLTFDAQGTVTTNSPGYQTMNGTYQITSTSDGSIINSGDITSGKFSNNSDGASITLVGTKADIIAPCSTSDTNNIQVGTYTFIGPVECSSSQGGGSTTAQPSSLTGSSQGTDRGGSSSSSSSSSSSNSIDSNNGSSSSNSKDGDSDGIPDSSDRCTHNSNTRCFKEGEASTTTTQQQQQPSSNGAGNQTR